MSKKRKILVDLRPALQGFQGIPQECRLLFRGLRTMDQNEIQGMIQSDDTVLARGILSERNWLGIPQSAARKIDRYARVIISLREQPYRTLIDRVLDRLDKLVSALQLTTATLLGLTRIRLTTFEPRHFEDFIWRTLFAKTLPASDFAQVTSTTMKICSMPWSRMHRVGLWTLNVFLRARYPLFHARGFDVFIAQTPYPAKVRRPTALIVRYHDAIPMFLPHTIPDMSVHQAIHFHALMANVRSGAYFACISEATRSALLTMFPQLAKRAVTIHNMVSHHYFPEDSSPERVPAIIRSRLYGDQADAALHSAKDGLALAPEFLTLREKESFYQRVLAPRPFRYLLIVSSLEPRKNHARLLVAWEVLTAESDPDLKLVVVGSMGWGYEQLVASFRSWIDRGKLFMLSGVPAPDLRVIYKHALATVCPSISEGFDFSGAEAMACGGVVAASDIAVHREVYDQAAEYFDPYSTMSLVQALRKLIYDADAESRRARMRALGAEVAARYVPERILPQWEDFLRWVMEDRRRGISTRQSWTNPVLLPETQAPPTAG